MTLCRLIRRGPIYCGESDALVPFLQARNPMPPFNVSVVAAFAVTTTTRLPALGSSGCPRPSAQGIGSLFRGFMSKPNRNDPQYSFFTILIVMIQNEFPNKYHEKASLVEVWNMGAGLREIMLGLLPQTAELRPKVLMWWYFCSGLKLEAWDTDS